MKTKRKERKKGEIKRVARREERRKMMRMH